MSIDDHNNEVDSGQMVPGDVMDVSRAPLRQVTLSVQGLDFNAFVNGDLWKAIDYDGDKNYLANVVVRIQFSQSTPNVGHTKPERRTRMKDKLFKRGEKRCR